MATILLTAASSANAGIKITRIYFDPADADTGSNGHLNKEWIVIKNIGQRAVRLDGWKLHDRGVDHTYVFGDETQGDDVFTDIRLQPGGYIRLHTGRGQDSATASSHGDIPTYYDFYWDLDNYVWNNDGDRASIQRPNGTIVDRCAYSGVADSPVAC